MKNFDKIYNLTNISMIESQLQKIYKIPVYPGDSKLYSDKGFVDDM